MTISPLIVFDYYHKGSNITAPLRVIEMMKRNNSNLNPFSKIVSVTKALSRVWYLDLGKNNTDEILFPCNISPEAQTTNAKWPLVIIGLGILTSFFFKKDFSLLEFSP